jgi:hypothetical protein
MTAHGTQLLRKFFYLIINDKLIDCASSIPSTGTRQQWWRRPISRRSRVHSKVPNMPEAGDQPTRLLLIRSKAGDLPWLAKVIVQQMAPVDLVQVVGLDNALWRLSNDRFDSILLDLDLASPSAIRRCREQIGQIAATPVINLRDQDEVATANWPTVAEAPRPQAPAFEPRGRPTRLPWQRRPRRPHAGGATSSR